MMKKVLFILLFVGFLEANSESNQTQKESLLKLIVMVGNWLKGTFVSDGIFFEEARVENQMSVSSFVIKPRANASVEEIEFVDLMRSDEKFQKGLLDEFAFLNQEKLCGNKMAKRWKELDIVIEYRFRFAEQQSPFAIRQVKANECQLSK